MAAERFLHDRVDDRAGDHRAVRVAPDRRFLDDLLHHDDHVLGRERDFLLTAEQPPDLRVAVGVGSLRGDDRDVRP